MADKLRIAVVGCGSRAQTVHLPYLKKNPRVIIRAICDSDEAKLSWLADRYHPEVATTDYNEILRDKETDAVVISSPNYLHHPMAVAALDYSKHVLVEMPMALDEAHARELISHSRNRKRVLAVAHTEHFRPDAILMRQLVERNEIGQVTYAKTGWLRSAQKWSLVGWRREKLYSGGGAFLTLGVPLLDLSLFILGDREPLSISGMAFKRDPEMEVEDSAVAQLRFADNTVLTIEVSWIIHELRDILYFNIYGTKGAALLAPFEIHKEMFSRLVNVAPALNKKNVYPSSYQTQANAFVSAALKNTKYPVPLEDALLLNRITDAFYKSVKERKEVSLSSRKR